MSAFARSNDAEKRRRTAGIIALRQRGWKFRDIGLVYGISESYASELFRLRRVHFGHILAAKSPNYPLNAVTKDCGSSRQRARGGRDSLVNES
jgi:hypothetical protein